MTKEDKRMGSNPLEGMGLDISNNQDEAETKKKSGNFSFYASFDSQLGLCWTKCMLQSPDVAALEPFLRLFLAAFIPGRHHTIKPLENNQPGLIVQFQPSVPIAGSANVVQEKGQWQWLLPEPLYYVPEALEINLSLHIDCSGLNVKESNADQVEGNVYTWHFTFSQMHEGMVVEMSIDKPVLMAHEDAEKDSNDIEPQSRTIAEAPAPGEKDEAAVQSGQEYDFHLDRTDWLRLPVHVQIGQPYAIRFFDEYNSRRFGKDYDLQALRFRILRANGRDAYAKSSYFTLHDGWGISNDYDDPEARIVAIDEIIILEIKSLRPAYSGSFGLLVESDEKNESQCLALGQGHDLTLSSRESSWIHFMTQPGVLFAVYLYDKSHSLADKEYTLPSAIFRVVDVDGKSDYDPDCLKNRSGRWGLAATEEKAAAIIRAQDNLVYLNLESRTREDSGTFGLYIEKLSQDPQN